MDRIDRVAREAFGFEALRPGQREAIESVLAGRDTLVVMSTGSGKSAIYQIAGLLTEGATVVVSPLIALQRDQVETSASAPPAERRSSTPRAGGGARRARCAELAEDALEFLFLAPEQLANEEVLAELSVARPSLLVVDEAHCISEWGHDFRPEYLRLGAAAEALGRPPILALTATAAPPVRDEIVERLGLRDPGCSSAASTGPTSTSRSSASTASRGPSASCGRCWTPSTRRRSRASSTSPRAARPRSSRESLCERGVRRRLLPRRHARGRARRGAGALHGRGARRRGRHHRVRHGHRQGRRALGLPQRGPRVARRLLPGDRARAAATASRRRRGSSTAARTSGCGASSPAGGHVEVDEIAQVLAAVAGGVTDPATLQDATELSETKLASALARLEEAGAVACCRPARSRRPPRTAARGGRARRPRRRRSAASFDRSRVDMMRGYAEADGCRREFLLSYFGEPFRPPCGRCDNCEAGRGEAPAEDVPFAVGARVAHEQWGEGVVQRYDDDAVVVLFDDVGYKTLALGVRARARAARGGLSYQRPLSGQPPWPGASQLLDHRRRRRSSIRNGPPPLTPESDVTSIVEVARRRCVEREGRPVARSTGSSAIRSLLSAVANVSRVVLVHDQRLGDERRSRLRLRVLRLRTLVEEEGHPDGGEDPDDQDHHQQLDECESALRLHCRSLTADQAARMRPLDDQSALRPAAASTSRAIARAASGRARRAEAAAIAARRPVSATSASTSARSRSGRQLGVGQHGRGPGVLHPAGVRLLVVAGRVRIRDQQRRQPVLGELEHRSARARHGEVGRRQREAERDHVVAQDVVRARRREGRRSRAGRPRAGSGTARRRTRAPPPR